jgi:hypothetical protein
MTCASAPGLAPAAVSSFLQHFFPLLLLLLLFPLLVPLPLLNFLCQLLLISLLLVE